MNGLDKGIDLVSRVLNTVTITYLGVDTRESFYQLYYNLKRTKTLLQEGKKTRLASHSTKNDNEMEM